MIQQTIQNVSCIPNRGINYLNVKWGILVGEMRVKNYASIFTILGINLFIKTAMSACFKPLTINEMLWILRTGAPWRDLSERYGAWETVVVRYS